MYEFVIHTEAAADLREILAKDPAAGRKIALLVSQLRDDQYLLDRLNQHDYGGTPANPRPKHAKLNVSWWVAARNINLNLWRMRFFDQDTLGYRLVYAYRPNIDQYILLGIVEKADMNDPTDERFDYELNHPVAIRILAAYRSLDD